MAHPLERGQKIVGELQGTPSVNGMAQNPMLATLLCLAFSPESARPPLRFPVRRVEVYERVLEGLLGEWEAIKGNQQRPRGLINAKRRLLAEIARHFFPDKELSGDSLHDFLWGADGYLSELKDTHPLHQALKRNDTTPEEELCKDGILVPCNGMTSYMFLHLTFQEYLTACAFAHDLELPTFNAQSSQPKRIYPIVHSARDNGWMPKWQEVFTLGCRSHIDDTLFTDAC